MVSHFSTSSLPHHLLTACHFPEELLLFPSLHFYKMSHPSSPKKNSYENYLCFVGIVLSVPAGVPLVLVQSVPGVSGPMKSQTPKLLPFLILQNFQAALESLKHKLNQSIYPKQSPTPLHFARGYHIIHIFHISLVEARNENLKVLPSISPPLLQIRL